jgi:hypothetical protein
VIHEVLWPLELRCVPRAERPPITPANEKEFLPVQPDSMRVSRKTRLTRFVHQMRDTWPDLHFAEAPSGVPSDVKILFCQLFLVE